MHPVMFTIPGWGFKLIVPLLILWGAYQLVTTLNRPAASSNDKGADATTTQPPPDSIFNGLSSIVVALLVFGFASNTISRTESAASGVTGLRLVLRHLVEIVRSIANGQLWRAPWESFPIYSYGVMLGLSLVAGWYIVLPLMRRQSTLPPGPSFDEYNRHMADCYVFTAFAAVAGARGLYVLTNLSEFPTVWSMLKLRSGGLVAYGGFLGGLLGSIVFLRSKGYSLWPWADAAVPSLGSGLSITRLGCYMYGCDFGRPLAPSAPTFLKKLGSFPHWADNHGAPAWQQHVSIGFRTTRELCERDYHGMWSATERVCKIPFTHQHSVPVHPTQLYESLIGFTLFVVLIFMWRRRKFEGQIFLAFGVLYGVARSLLEIIRDDAERGVVGPLSTSQFIGIVTAIIAVVLYLHRAKTAPSAIGIDFFALRAPVTATPENKTES